MTRLLMALVRFYRRRISPYTPDACKYHPTCSAYALRALETHGAFLGSLLAVWRILRCNPFSNGGYDPVPPKGDVRNHGRALAALKR